MLLKIIMGISALYFIALYFLQTDRLNPKELKVKKIFYTKRTKTITCIVNHPFFNRFGKRENQTQETTIVKYLNFYNNYTITKNPDDGRIEGKFLNCDTEYLIKNKIEDFEKNELPIIKLKQKKEKIFTENINKNQSFLDLKINTQIYTKNK